MAKVHVNGVDLAYDDSGRGDALVLLHAGIADRRMWDDVTPMLAEGYRVIACDLRGFGETPLPDGPFVYAADVAGLIAGLGVERAHVAGVSLGGHVALDLVLAHPELVDRLVLVGAGIDGWEHEPALRALWEKEEAAFERGELDEVAWINVRTWLDGPTRGETDVPAALRRRVYEMQRAALDHENPAATGGWLTSSRRQRLGEVTAPTLVLVGALDQRDFRRIARVLADEIPGARFEELPGVAHLPPLERPEAFARTVLAFLG
ncbi:MAG: alpha/beta hydrolase [Gaiella sp.]|nr:alpha/beta hydrolase [Gaiella sp.]